MRRVARVLAVVAAVAAVAFGVVAPPASAHIERPSYWPLPGPDCSVSPCAGGVVPTARSLASAVTATPGSVTRVVCRPDSLKLLSASIAHARKYGYDIRPHDHRTFSTTEAAALTQVNKVLLGRCAYSEIQPAVTASGNNDRVVVLPGVYTEPTARTALTHDPACDKYKESSGAYSYLGEYTCQNDANLIAVMGRAPGPGTDPDPPLIDRHGIPNRGACVRCNLQLEGSGVSADDVVVDAGDPASGNHGPRGSVKDVGIRADRADGFVLRNMTVRHANEHDIYVLETNGYLLDRFKTFYAGEYGVLTFVEDHGLMQNCEAAGSGDSGLYPGAGAKTGAGRDTSFYPVARYSQEIRRCDVHHNTGGYSGTDGSATWVHDNNFYDNALGFTTDVFTAAGHPGFPQQGDLVEHNNFYSNNFNPYVAGSDVVPTTPLAVGTGMWIAGGDDNVVRNNHFTDNKRRGVMLFSAPDAFVCGPGGTPVTGCDPWTLSTSHRNQFYGNTMSGNGVDFWWDNFPLNVGNCWWDNGAVKTSPANLPDCLSGKAPWLSIGYGDIGNEAELLTCLSDLKPGGACPWFTSPAASAVSVKADGYDDGSIAEADCTYWTTATAAQRQTLLDTMHLVFGGQIDHPAAGGPTLSTQRATSVFDNACAMDMAKAFKLYKLYTRAAAFTLQTG